MRPLQRHNINWQLYILIAILIRITFFKLSWLSYLAVIISLFQFSLVFFAVNEVIPYRYLFGSFMCLQMLIGPMLAYNGLDEFQYGFNKMQIPEEDYFMYVIPAVLSFIAGLNIMAKDLPGERPDVERIKEFVRRQPDIPYIFIIVGFFSSFIRVFFSADFAFLFVLLSALKYVGLFIIIIGNRQLKPWPLVLVYGSIISSSIAEGMFHDLLTWLLLLAAVFAIKLKPNNLVKMGFVVVFVFIALTIQQLKGDYREATWKRGEEGSLETLTKTYESQKEQKQLFSYERLAESNIRINQGYIITNVMRTVPERVPFENGKELAQILESAFLPRIIAPNKLNAGDRQIFMKYTGMPLAAGTSMGISSVGDAYINFGIMGGWIFMFCFGLMFNLVLKAFHYYSYFYPILLILTSVMLYYPIRPDCELQTILGHFFKAIFLITAIIQIWKQQFLVRPKFA